MTVTLVKVTPGTIVYTVGSNVPGYLPESDVAVFASIESARIYLADELDQLADYLADVESDDTDTDPDESSMSDYVSAMVEIVKHDTDGNVTAWITSGGWTTYIETGRSLPTAYWINAVTIADAFGDDTDTDEYHDLVSEITGY